MKYDGGRYTLIARWSFSPSWLLRNDGAWINSVLYREGALVGEAASIAAAASVAGRAVLGRLAGVGGAAVGTLDTGAFCAPWQPLRSAATTSPAAQDSA